MKLDIRLPLGLLFLAVGILLALYGAWTHADTALYVPSLGINLNLFWGLALTAFGAVMVWFGRRVKGRR